MKSYGELRIELRGITPEAFGERAESAASNGWIRDRSKDDRMRQEGGGIWFTFVLTGQLELPPAFLFVSDHGNGKLFVPNVISPARDHLSYDEYNSILASFRDNVLAHITPKEALSVTLTGDTINLSESLPADIYRRLKSFSELANKSTGSGHPYDRERWFDFLIAAARGRVSLDASTLNRWLVEEGRWSVERASRLAEEYEFGRELMQQQEVS